MSDFLLELRSEEIPARMQKGARQDLARLFTEQMVAAGIEIASPEVFSTPRRLALIARNLPEHTEAVSEERKGPKADAPDKAIEGFLRSTGLARDQLEVMDVKGTPTLFAVTEVPGRAVSDVLAEAIPAIVRAFPWPKSMRWGEASLSTESLRWVRPLSGIVALLDGEIVPCEVHGVTSGAVTLGHRFHHSGDITIGGADDYAMKLRAAHVIVDHAEREALICKGAHDVAAQAGLDLVEDEGLVVENAGLTEWPIPLLGHFDEDFLAVPPEVIQLTARTNQKYFVCERDGKLADAFICTANIEGRDGGEAIVDGNRKVLAARLADARFFWEQDRKKTLAQHAEGLERITFHEKLGTVADKVERVAKLARWLAEEGIVPGADPDLAEQAAHLAKADLVTEMVGEFPELQGVIGGYYARAEGLDDAVADAIRDHYKPVGQGEEVPTAPVTVAVSLADKLDTLAGFFAVDERPTGSKDPFALRRAALSSIQLIMANELRFALPRAFLSTSSDVLMGRMTKGANDLYDRLVSDLRTIQDRGANINTALQGLRASLDDVYDPMKEEGLKVGLARIYDLLDFFADRLKIQQREAGVRHDLIDAVFALGNEDDLVRLLSRVNALQTFIASEDGANLLAAYKRAANILKKEDWHGIEGEIARTGEEDPLAIVDDPDLKAVVDAKMAQRHSNALSYTPEPAEKALMDVLDQAEPKAKAAAQAEDFSGAMSALASLRAPIDRFFDEVTVNADDQDKRTQRLNLLARFRAAVDAVADFSRIEG
ncbi:glycine--tRNA ligase subunit beta [Altererythrobacter sp. SALINAS58]|uniref:glycine--tRNA ligase subunit beta n=1 Tax=Alteripontixanthobacter muriae TaxID=2705546 RepID=UPI00157544EF|nr:glycine--tRNA ligase subunit beta [Alteripontixanthobacter muriae]NTZ41829.1 glycine--tRNA ligase subunit beta [Alteripontixanthobacter muriae]